MKNSKKLLLASLTMTTFAMSAGLSSANEINKEGYLTDTRGDVVRSGSGLCWHTGYWTPEMAIAECDEVKLSKVEPKIVESKPVPAPIPVPAVEPKKVRFMPVTLQTETLFEFNRSDISPAGRMKINEEVVGKMKALSHLDIVLVTGHADRIGSVDYNQDLSQRRADSIKAYLVSQGMESSRIEVRAKGESEPVVSCDQITGPANGTNLKLVECLQPNRRAELEVKGEKTVAPQ